MYCHAKRVTAVQSEPGHTFTAKPFTKYDFHSHDRDGDYINLAFAFLLAWQQCSIAICLSINMIVNAKVVSKERLTDNCYVANQSI